ncbi:MBL fold metallo-hydrolase [Neptuniibacter sp.]|uniref:MBL fold metallo-hydrolase n=1 Tax=Neptuniibacter sp. TaxID=1962643 RepID=UPI002638112A|nr:MBL fold metallo-hydrolase [Neptuniibacter sp.]MCP4597379.1 MBL fold metallo-hydrolase [Neptuniibacter sp.]
MKYRVIPVTAFQQNCTLLWCENSKKAAVVDPGGDLEKVIAAAEQEGVEIEKILLTHAHIDHAGGTAELSKSKSLPIEGPHLGDKFWIDGIAQQCSMFNFPLCEGFTPDRWLDDGDSVQVGEEILDVIHCPGHTPGHVVFYNKNDQVALVGDVLFNGSIGRTDFPQGNHQELIDSIKNKLFPLGEDVEFIPGHGPGSTFGQEMQSNPFVR